MAMKKINTEKEESTEKIIGEDEDSVPNSFGNQEIYQQQMRQADMESQLENLKEQLTKTKQQLEKTEILLREERSLGNQKQKTNLPKTRPVNYPTTQTESPHLFSEQYRVVCPRLLSSRITATLSAFRKVELR